MAWLIEFTDTSALFGPDPPHDARRYAFAPDGRLQALDTACELIGLGGTIWRIADHAGNTVLKQDQVRDALEAFRSEKVARLAPRRRVRSGAPPA